MAVGTRNVGGWTGACCWFSVIHTFVAHQKRKLFVLELSFLAVESVVHDVRYTLQGVRVSKPSEMLQLGVTAFTDACMTSPSNLLTYIYPKHPACCSSRGEICLFHTRASQEEVTGEEPIRTLSFFLSRKSLCFPLLDLDSVAFTFLSFSHLLSLVLHNGAEGE